MLRRIKRKKMTGQSAAELAIFGSIVMFVIGMMLKSSLAVSQKANMDLRAFRMALHESYATALGKYSQAFSAGRNNAYILVIEDRLSIDPSKKQGTRDRAPYMAQGSATMSINLFMDINEHNEDDLPVYDVFINGQRFPLSISRVETKTPYNLLTSNGGHIPECVNGYGHLVGTCWDGTHFRFFRKSYNGEEGVWCDSGACGGWSADRRFDLDFDGTTDVSATDAVPGDVAGSLRRNFGWQWVPVEEQKVVPNTLVDIDGDLKEEKILGCNGGGATFQCEVVDNQDGDFDLSWDQGTETFLERMGMPVHKPGLSQNIRTYSFTKEGTMLRNEEGRLYAAVNGQFVRNETKQDHLDIIERVLNLSNQTGRFCQNANTLRDWSQVSWARAHGVLGMTNPVEACGNCFGVGADGVDRRKLTCMDTNGPTLFIRSRIRDRRRSRWVTLTDKF